MSNFFKIEVHMRVKVICTVLIFSTLSFMSLADSITVKGESIVSTAPDQAGLVFKVTTKNKEAIKAQAENSKIMKALTEGLRKKFSLKDNEIVTARYNLVPRFNYPRDKAPEFQDMEVQNEVALTIKKIDDTAMIINFLTDNGVSEIYNIDFSSSKEEELKVSALEAAYDNALMKANALAKKAGKKVGEVDEIRESFSQTPAPRTMHFEAKMMGSAPVIEKGNVGISASVEVKFDIR